MQPFSVIIFFSAVLSVILAVYSFRFRKTPGALSFSGIMVCVFFHSFGYGIELNSTTLQQMQYCIYIEYIGLSFESFFWLKFVTEFVSNKKWINRKTWPFFLIVPTITFISNITNPYHHLFYTSLSINYSLNFPVIVLIKGPLYWFNTCYFYIILAISNVLVIKSIISSRNTYRRQAAIIFIGFMLPWLSNVIYLADILKGLDPIPVSQAITGVLFSVALFRYRLFDFVPIAVDHVYKSISEGILLFDKQMRLTSFNPAANRIFPELTPRDIGGRFDDLFGRYLDLVERQGADFNFSTNIDGQQRYFMVSLSTDHGLGVDKDFRIFTFFDITEQHEIERKLRALNSSKDKFFSIVANDLKNPFSSINSTSNELIRNFNDYSSDEIKEHVQSIHQVSQRSFDLLESLLIWTRLQTGSTKFQPESVDLGVLAQKVIDEFSFLALNKQINLHNAIPSGIIAHVDLFMMKTTFEKIISNAIKYSFANGSVTIIISKSNDTLTITIDDKGEGMTSEQIRSLFRIEGVSSRPGTIGETGTGLGLIICKEFMNCHGGTIDVNSHFAEGTTVRLNLPLSVIIVYRVS